MHLWWLKKVKVVLVAVGALGTVMNQIQKSKFRTVIETETAQLGSARILRKIFLMSRTEELTLIICHNAFLTYKLLYKIRFQNK